MGFESLRMKERQDAGCHSGWCRTFRLCIGRTASVPLAVRLPKALFAGVRNGTAELQVPFSGCWDFVFPEGPAGKRGPCRITCCRANLTTHHPASYPVSKIIGWRCSGFFGGPVVTVTAVIWGELNQEHCRPSGTSFTARRDYKNSPILVG
jgi:hypothetical protein